MKKLLYFACAVFSLTALAVSCEKNPIEPVNPDEGSQVRTFTCVIADNPDSKLAIDGTGKSTWEVGDEISIHGGANGAARTTVTLSASDISADGKTATISFNLDPYDRTDAGVASKYYAEYPASAVPSGNLYYECGFNKTNEILMAACDVGDTFVFYNLCSVISFTVSGDFDKYVFAGKNGETVGYNLYQARIRNNNSGMEVNYWKPGNGIPEANITPLTQLEKDVTCDGTTLNYICIPSSSNKPKCVSFSGGFMISFIKDGNIVKTASIKNSFSLAVGDYLPLGNITSHLKDYVAPTEHDSAIDITNATDLSATASANCYIVNANDTANQDKVFKFKAVKGNGNVSVGSVESAVILWETYNNAESVTANSVISQVDYDLHNDECYIVFKMPSTLHAGNAVIAAKNGAGEILWSWHIWVPETTVTSNTYGIYSSALMDRNLGALVAATTTSVPVESFGLHYEWGRKDPFVGARSITDNSFAKVSGASISIGYEMTLAETIANPTQYAVYTSTDSWGNWLTPYDATLWQDDTKTMYDPCPVGYKVPKYSSSQPLHSSDLSTVTGWSDNAAAGDNAAYFTLGSPVSVFPYCGLVCENGKYMDHLGDRTFIWTAHASSSSGSGYMMDVRFNTSTHKSTSTVTSRGCSVRCVAE